MKFPNKFLSLNSKLVNDHNVADGKPESVWESMMTRHSSVVFQSGCLKACRLCSQWLGHSGLSLYSEECHRNSQLCSTCILIPKSVCSLAFDQSRDSFPVRRRLCPTGELDKTKSGTVRRTRKNRLPSGASWSVLALKPWCPLMIIIYGKIRG